MKRAWPLLALVALAALPMSAAAQSCSIGGHNETSENFAAPSWASPPVTPGTVPGGLTGTHLLISEVAPRGVSTTAGSDSSEFIEIYNPTTRPVRLDNKYISDDIAYYRVVNGPFAVGNVSDYCLKFPAGLTLMPGRTLVLADTKAGFAASGGTAAAAQIFLEMRDSNGNTSDDMINVATGTTIALTGGMLTNPSSTNGEWAVLFCWESPADLVCDIDYASWGANAASNPKMNKTGVSIDGPDAGAATSAYLPDTPAASQSNLGSGTTPPKPQSYQRVAAESGETSIGGNGCVGRAVPAVISWLPVSGTTNIRFALRWQNPDEDAPSNPVNGQLNSQEFGVFLPDYGQIGSFNVPPLQPSSFFDVFIDIPLSQLPPPPEKHIPGDNLMKTMPATYGGGPHTSNDCPPDTNWAGNVDIQWSATGGGGQVNKHYGDLLTCAGGAPSYIHFRPSNCTSPMPWSLVGVCPGFTVTLVNEDFTPAPNPVPVGWSGWISVQATAAALGTNCCFGIVFQCGNATSTIDICSTACNCSNPVGPTLGSVDWTTNGNIVTFHQHWENPNSAPTAPVTGTMSSQEFGVFLPDYGPIGQFNVPPIAPNSFFDVFIDIDRALLPAEPQVTAPAGVPPDCLEDHWHGNVNILWDGNGGPGQQFKHFGEMPVCPGAGPTYLFVEVECNAGTAVPWTLIGSCPGWTFTLVNQDSTPAPNPLPPSWVGLIAVQAAAGIPAGDSCCFKIRFTCGGVPGVIDVCAKACNCQATPPPPPVLTAIDWTKIPGNIIRFHQVWKCPPGADCSPLSGQMNSQPFGAFAPDFGPIGQFNVPPLQPNSFFDVFLEIPESQLPPEPQTVLPGGGPAPGSPCPPDTSWSGNVDINWAGPGGVGQTNYHFTNLLVRPGTGSSHVHTLIFCNSPSTFSITNVCPGFSVALLNEDFTPAPNPVPANWTGWISVAAANSVPAGTNCCFTVTFHCDGHDGEINVCAETCAYQSLGVANNPRGVDFGIVSTVPNPSSNGMAITFAMPTADVARVDVYNLSGQRVRSLVNGRIEAGTHSVKWNGRGENGRALPPGAYFISLKSGERAASRRIVLIQ